MRILSYNVAHNHRWVGWWLVLLVAAWACLSWQLEQHPLLNWDEARLAVNAAEMLRSHNWIVTSYGGEPDLWNTKPPLLVWLQALSLASFEYSEWAFRLPTMLASWALLGLVVLFARRWLGGPLAGFLTGFVLLSSKTYITLHVARSGDYEALLLLLMTGQVLSIFAWLQTRQKRYLLLAGLSVGLAVLTKSIVGLLFVPGFVLAIAQRGRLGLVLRQPVTWLAGALALGIPLLWYTLREQAAPGYLLAVWQNELGGRFAGVLEEHNEPWYFYLISFVSRPYLLWTPWLIATCWVLARRPVARPAHRFLALTAWTAGSFFLIISCSATKLRWYDAPMYPLLALLIGSGLAYLVQQVAARRWVVPPRAAAGLLLMLALLPSGIAMYRHLVKLHHERFDTADHNYGSYLRDPRATPYSRYTLFSPGYNASLRFYALAAQQATPTDTLLVAHDIEQLAAGQTVLVCGNAAIQQLRQLYELELLYQANSCVTYRIRNGQ